jgi:hypothetical protein
MVGGLHDLVAGKLALDQLGLEAKLGLSGGVN